MNYVKEKRTGVTPSRTVYRYFWAYLFLLFLLFSPRFRFLVLCGRFSWLVNFWAYVKMASLIVSYKQKNVQFWATMHMYNKMFVTSVGSSGAGWTGCAALYCFVLRSAANAFETLNHNHIQDWWITTAIDSNTANSVTFKYLLKTGRKHYVLTVKALSFRIYYHSCSLFRPVFRRHVRENIPSAFA